MYPFFLGIFTFRLILANIDFFNYRNVDKTLNDDDDDDDDDD